MSLSVLHRARPYSRKILRLEPIAYWPLIENSGTVAACRVNTAQNGAYTSVTLGQAGIGDGETCPLFDGANDYVNVYSATFASAFNGAEGTIAYWWNVSGAGVWTDSTRRDAVLMAVDGANYIIIGRATVNNRFPPVYTGGGTYKAVNQTISSTGWVAGALTWSKSANQLKAYSAGAQTGSTVTGLGTWAGPLLSTQVIIGAAALTPSNVWSGYLAHVAVWSSALSAATIAELAVI